MGTFSIHELGSAGEIWGGMRRGEGLEQELTLTSKLGREVAVKGQILWPQLCLM